MANLHILYIYTVYSTPGKPHLQVFDAIFTGFFACEQGLSENLLVFHLITYTIDNDTCSSSAQSIALRTSGMDMPARVSRRIFIKAAIGATAASSSLILSGCGEDYAVDRKLEFASLSAALAEAEKLASRAITESGSLWTLPQTLVHCAQSIEYSMSGFPQMKSELFQDTAGAAAFSFFAWRGRMSHDLTEAIPGAPPLTPETGIAQAMTRLRNSVANFELWREPLRPHFAYGQLDKPDYEIAHAMHLANHFSAIAV